MPTFPLTSSGFGLMHLGFFCTLSFHLSAKTFSSCIWLLQLLFLFRLFIFLLLIFESAILISSFQSSILLLSELILFNLGLLDWKFHNELNYSFTNGCLGLQVLAVHFDMKPLRYLA